MKQRQLQTVILGRVLPKTTVVLIGVIVMTWALVQRMITSEVERRVELSAYSNAEQISGQFDLLSDSCRAIAQHGIVVNSIVDTQHRQMHLPAFFNSLRLPGPAEQCLCLLDYRGRVIAERGEIEYEPQDNAAILSSLKRQGHFKAISSSRVTFASPVVYHGGIEAICVSQYDTGQFMRSPAFANSSIAFNGQELWRGKRLPENWHSQTWVTKSRSVDGFDSLVLTVYASWATAYSPLFVLGGGLALACLLCLLSVFASIWSASKIAGHQVNLFISKLGEIHAKKTDQVTVSNDAPHEFHQLAQHFNELLAELGRTMVSHDEVRKAEIQLQDALSGANAVAWDWNLNDDSVHFSPQITKQLRLERPWDNVSDWLDALHPEDREQTQQTVNAYLNGETEDYRSEFRLRCGDGQYLWICGIGKVFRNAVGEPQRFVGVNVDISAQRYAEAEQQRLSEELAEASRYAGMAQVATGVLHNVGNVLNSVNVNAELLRRNLHGSRVEGVEKVANLLTDQGAELAEFFTSDERSDKLVPYLRALAAQLAEDKSESLELLEGLRESLHHVKEIVVAQQSLAKRSGVKQAFGTTELVEMSLKLCREKIRSVEAQLETDYRVDFELTSDRHLCLQILVNLVRNACDATNAASRDVRRIQVVVDYAGEDRVSIQVIDNGIGIREENLSKLFQHGFTTRSAGHGFGLHSCANAAGELGGSLEAHSEGDGQGSVFTLTLPRNNRRRDREVARVGHAVQSGE